MASMPFDDNRFMLAARYVLAQGEAVLKQAREDMLEQVLAAAKISAEVHDQCFMFAGPRYPTINLRLFFQKGRELPDEDISGQFNAARFQFLVVAILLAHDIPDIPREFQNLWLLMDAGCYQQIACLPARSGQNEMESRTRSQGIEGILQFRESVSGRREPLHSKDL